MVRNRSRKIRSEPEAVLKFQRHLYRADCYRDANFFSDAKSPLASLPKRCHRARSFASCCSILGFKNRRYTLVVLVFYSRFAHFVL